MSKVRTKKAISQLKKLKKVVLENSESPRLAAEGWNENWKTLIAIILSAQTRDTKTISVCEDLFEKYKTPRALGNANLSEIEKDIGSINYYKTKAKRIKAAAQKIAGEGLPESVGGLIKYPGVGRKTANVYLVAVHGAAAIGVDTHVGRISRKLGWTDKNEPSKVEKDLENLFPKKYWNSINYILVKFGQTIGRSRKKEDEVLANL